MTGLRGYGGNSFCAVTVDTIVRDRMLLLSPLVLMFLPSIRHDSPCPEIQALILIPSVLTLVLDFTSAEEGLGSPGAGNARVTFLVPSNIGNPLFCREKRSC
jgi:hypothetical protein